MIPFILKEGLYDPGIFKAFFLAGGPGSGKTYVTNKVMGGMGLKNVNSDRAFEIGLKKAGLSLKMPEDEAKKRDPIRLRAKELTGKALENYIQGRLGLVVDSTGRDYESIARPVSLLKQMGYDCYMVFVNTSLEVAMVRNTERERTVPPEIVKNNWNTVQQNIGKFQRLFGQQKMIIIDNNKADEKIITNVYKQVAKFVKKPVDNHIAKQWIRKETDKRKI
jgi:predicted kinase